jgi:hypothetical protein
MSAVYSCSRWPSWLLHLDDFTLRHTGPRPYTVDLTSTCTDGARMAVLIRSDRLGPGAGADLAAALGDLLGEVGEGQRLAADEVRRRVRSYVAHAKAGL